MLTLLEALSLICGVIQWPDSLVGMVISGMLAIYFVDNARTLQLSAMSVLRTVRRPYGAGVDLVCAIR